MKKINNIIAIAIIAIFAVACTDENDYGTNQINQKTLVQDGGIYSSYEDKIFTDDQLSALLSEFNNALNDKDVIMPDYDISTALTNMEFHFNYGIVVKMPFNKNAEPYDKLTFSFNVPIENNIIKGTALKNAYISFVNGIVRQMEGKNLEISDLYVKDVSSTLVTFELEMEPLRVPFGADDATMPAFKRIKDLNSVSIPANVTSRWDNLPSWSLCNGIGVPCDPNYERGAYEIVVHDNSFERWPSNYFNSRRGMLVYGHLRGNHGEVNIGAIHIVNPGSPVVWNSDQIEYFVKGSIVAANSCNSRAQWGWVVYNYSSVVCFSKEVDIYNATKDKYQLRVQDVRTATLSLLDLSFLYMSALTSPIL
ncbi:MAG: hypothetical protein PHO86_05810 [Bacilli bacterium]|nr:hypothetical protein [Bacilli bacterium]